MSMQVGISTYEGTCEGLTKRHASESQKSGGDQKHKLPLFSSYESHVKEYLSQLSYTYQTQTDYY